MSDEGEGGMSQWTENRCSLAWALTPGLEKAYAGGATWEPSSTSFTLEKNAWLTFAACRRIQTWALEEARRRLEAEGILEDPDKKN